MLDSYIGEKGPFHVAEFKKNYKESVRKCEIQAPRPEFDPYSSEGGTVAGIAGEDYVVLAGDTRLSNDGLNILTRSGDKVFNLSDDIVLISTGFYGDIMQLVRVLQAKIKMYKFTYNDPMDIEAASEMLARTLYYQRFFPYYTGNLFGGITHEGKGALYRYDPIGTLERVDYACGGSGTGFIDPFFDNQIGGCNLPTKPKVDKDKALKLMLDAFRAAGERETSTGDGINVVVLEKGKKPEIKTYPLRSD